MFGVEGVVDRVLWRLQTGMPGKLVELRGRYSVVDGSLEDVTRWLTHEPDDIAIDKPPMVIVTEVRSDTIASPVRVLDDGAGGTVYRYRYHLVVMVWARGDTFDSTARVRRRYGLAVRELLLQMPGLGGDGDPGTIVLIPETIVETYSDIARDGRSREIIAATAFDLEYETQETLTARLPAGPSPVLQPEIGVTP